MIISADAFNLIVQEETGGQPYYNAHYIHPDWPGGASGVTVGIGYDAGYCTPAQLKSDWADILPDNMVEHLASVAGFHGRCAQPLARELLGVVSVSWDQALKVFQNVDVPRWERNVQNSLPNTGILSGHSFGALVSLAFNRGCSFTLLADRYREMREINTLMEAKQFAKIPDQFRSMARLWPNSAGLRDRRFKEAALFEKGLS